MVREFNYTSAVTRKRLKRIMNGTSSNRLHPSFQFVHVDAETATMSSTDGCTLRQDRLPSELRSLKTGNYQFTIEGAHVTAIDAEFEFEGLDLILRNLQTTTPGVIIVVDRKMLRSAMEGMEKGYVTIVVNTAIDSLSGDMATISIMDGNYYNQNSPGKIYDPIVTIVVAKSTEVHYV